MATFRLVRLLLSVIIVHGQGIFTESISAADICGNYTIDVADSLVQFPWGVPLAFAYGALSAFTSSPFTYRRDSQLMDMYPFQDYVSLTLQSMVLLRVLYLGAQNIHASPNSTCGFLIFNMASLNGAAIAAYTNVIGVLFNICCGRLKDPDDRNGDHLDWRDPDLSMPAQYIAIFVSIIPCFTIALYFIVIIIGSLIMFITAVWLFCIMFPHVAILQFVITTCFCACSIVFGSDYYHTGHRDDWARKNNLHAILHEDGTVTYHSNYASAMMSDAGVRCASLVFIVAVQMVQGSGVLCWAFYTGAPYKFIQSVFFEGFSLPPIHWSFSLEFNLPELVWQSLTCNLKANLLLETSLSIQFFHYLLGILPRYLHKRCCRSKVIRYDHSEATVSYTEMEDKEEKRES
jgi:hypothetical protein